MAISIGAVASEHFASGAYLLCQPRPDDIVACRGRIGVPVKPTRSVVARLLDVYELILLTLKLQGHRVTSMS